MKSLNSSSAQRYWGNEVKREELGEEGNLEI